MVKGASVGDEIVIHTNHKQIHTKVLANNRFEVHVDNNDIKGDISATLTTKDLSGKVISVSDVQKIAQSLSNEQGVFKSHTGNQKPSGYFMTMNWTKKYDTVKIHGIDKGGNKDGTPSVIKYYFANQNDYKKHDAVQNNEIDQNKVSSYPNDIRQVIKQAYDKIGQYINVKFEETASYDDADVKLFMVIYPHQTIPIFKRMLLIQKVLTKWIRCGGIVALKTPKKALCTPLCTRLPIFWGLTIHLRCFWASLTKKRHLNLPT